jgi:hypothetical protein
MSTDPPTDFSAETLIHSFMTIILSEIGDKTFFISAILTMHHPRLPGQYCFPSLMLMSTLSASLVYIFIIAHTFTPKMDSDHGWGVIFGVWE